MAGRLAPSQRASKESIEQDLKILARSPLIQAIQDSVDGYLMVLNQELQVLAVNGRLLRELGLETPESLVGRRPGEALGCVHAIGGCEGCGTSQACATCATLLSILQSQKENQPVVGECISTVVRETQKEPLHFRVRAAPVKVAGQEFTVLVFYDITADRRRDALERVFFHDILNTITGLRGWSTLLSRGIAGNSSEVATRIAFLSHRLTREVQDQRMLMQAEKGTLQVHLEREPVSDLLALLATIVDASEFAKGRPLILPEIPSTECVVTDASIFLRVMTNMLKNAFEASTNGNPVSVEYRRQEGRPVFLVHNEASIPSEVVPHIFQRSFSTKDGTGRGVGTYSMKLFGEQYLRGEVGFETSEEKGTTFFIELPSREEL